MIEIKFFEVFKEEEMVLKKYLPRQIRAEFTEETIQQKPSLVKPAQIISIRTQSQIQLIGENDIKGILSRSQGYDHLQKYLRQSRKKIPCGYLGKYCSRSVAEHAIMLMFVLLRKMKKQIKQFEAFERNGLTGAQCKGKKVLVAGVGDIGHEIVTMSLGLQMCVKGFDKEKKYKNLSYVSLKEGIPWADVIFCALSLNKETHGMLNYAALKKAKKNVLLVNIARGEITPTKDLIRLIDEKRLGGAGLDVFEEEERIGDSLREEKLTREAKDLLGLSRRDNVIATPHNAFNTQEALEEKARLTAEALKYFLIHEKFPNPVRV